MTDLNPSDVLSDLPQPVREETNKTVYDRRPGHINWASDRASFSGCRVISFTGGNHAPPFQALGLEKQDLERYNEELDAYINALEGDEFVSAADVANLYFSKRANLLVLHMEVHADEVTFIITSQLDDDDLEEFQEVQRRVNLEMREWREEREKLRAADREKAQADRKLIELGKKAQEHNLFEKLRKLEAEVERLKKGGA
jgi:hypothetical protein